MKTRFISGLLSFAIIASSVLPAGAIDWNANNGPSGGALVGSDTVRVEKNQNAIVKVEFMVDPNSQYTQIAGALAKVAIPREKTGIGTDSKKLTITAGENVRLVNSVPSIGTTGVGNFNLTGEAGSKSLSVNLSIPQVKQTFPVEVTPSYVAAKETSTSSAVRLQGNMLKTAFGSVIVQYPVTVKIDGQKPAGASVSVKTTEYNTGKKTYAPGGTVTELNTNDKFWVDSDTSNNNPVLKITTPEGYTAEVTVNDGTATKSSGNVSLGAVAKDTTVKVKFVQGQDTNVYVTYNANGGVGTDKRVAVNGTHQVQENTFTRTNYVFSRWTDDEAGTGTIYKVGESKQIDASLTLYAQWFKQHTDGSIEVPGKDMGFGGDKDKDNVTVKPGADNKKPTVNRDGNVVVPDDSTGKVNVPDKTKPDKKTEVEVPGGTTVKPDGTIVLPGGTELDPANPNVTAGYVVTYEANNGTDSKRIVYVKNGEQHTVEANSFTYAGHVFSSWRDVDTITASDKFGTMVRADVQLSVAKTLKALWFKQDADGKITVPGVDGDLTKTEDNVSVKTNDSTKQPTINPDNGNAKVPTGTTGRIDRKDPANNGKTETIIVPEGTEVKPDGTIVFPGGKEVGPNEQITVDKLPTDWITVTYNSNNANSQTAKQVGASPVKAENNMFTPEQGKAFEGWYENKNFLGTKIAPGADVSTSKSLYARWKTAGTGDFKYNGKIEFHSNLDTDTTYEQIVSSADSASIAATLETPFNTDKPTGWELLGWSTEKNGAASGKWYEEGASVTVANGKTLVLYAIWHKTDNSNIVLPGVDGNTGAADNAKAEDNVTVKKENGTAPSPKKDKGYVEAVTGNKINLPKADKTKDVTVVTGPVNVYPDGTVVVPKGSKVTMPDGSEKDGPVVINPDGTIIKPDGSNSGNNNGGNSGNHGSSSGGSSTTTYTIKATAGNGGSISPKGNVSVVRSSDKLFNFTADAGYEVASVLVDGKDIGKVSSYNFTNVRAAHTIEVKFKKIGAVDPKPNTVADPKETGVANKLETDKHDAYMKGYANGTFGPNANMTRAEAAQMFYNLLLNKQPVADAGFTDVAADRWYADAVNTLAFMGIINGVGNNQFAPSRTISRAEFAAIATRFAKANSNGSLAFTDVKRSDWFYSSVLTAVNYGWIGGYSNGTFKPNNNITRAEVVSIVNKMLARSADKTFINSNASSIKSFTDVSKSFWGFYEVTEATNGHDHVKNDGVESWQ